MKAYVFDFDDTLAHTEGEIGVSHFEHGVPKDPMEWFDEIGLNRLHVLSVRNYSRCNVAYLDSSGFREYIATVKALGDVQIRDVGKETGVGKEDVLDFSHINDLKGAQPIDSIVEIARLASSRGDIVGVVTARKGMGFVDGLDGRRHPVTTRPDIHRFLAGLGVAIDPEDIFGVGHMPGPVSSNKREVVLSEFILKYNPEETIFYDDDGHNLREVSSLASQYPVVVHDARIVKEQSTPWLTGIVERARLRRRESEAWSRTRRLSLKT
jgi:FMN phosphatase YigB (HAD superfamily)